MKPDTRICVTLLAPNVSRAHKLALQARRKGAGLVEYRLDAFTEDAPDIANLVNSSPLECIVTCRLIADGGLNEVLEDTRIQMLKAALDTGRAIVDIEHDRADALVNHPRKEGQLIASYHNFKETPNNLKQIAEDISKLNVDVVKIASMATDCHSQLRCYEIMKHASKPTVAFAMGAFGSSSRVIALTLGAPWTYAALDEESIAAPGQLTVDALLANPIDADTAIYGVIGHPVGHSMSPLMLGAAFRAKHINAIYLPFDVDSDPADWITAMTSYGLGGFSVTIPHKLAARDVADVVDESVNQTQAANTIFLTDKGINAANTDIEGALDALASAAGGKDALKNKTALVVGAGGVSRAILFGLTSSGVHSTVTDIDMELARTLAELTGSKASEASEYDLGSFDIIINATPVGMHPNVDATPVDTNKLTSNQIVFDAVYNPLTTKLLREAEVRGCKTVQGVEMFIRQGAKQFEIWTGMSAPVDEMRKVVLEKLRENA